MWSTSLEWRSRSLDFVLESPDIVPLDSFIVHAGDSHGHDEVGEDGYGDHYEMRSNGDHYEMRRKWSTLIDGSFHH